MNFLMKSIKFMIILYFWTLFEHIFVNIFFEKFLIYFKMKKILFTAYIFF